MENQALWYGVTLLGITLGAGILYRHRSDIYHRRAGWGVLSSMLGWSLIALGLLGGLIPLFPGIVLGIPGLILVGPNDPIIRRSWAWLHRLAQVRAEASGRPLASLAHRFLRFEARLAQQIYREGELPPWETAQSAPATTDSVHSSPPESGPMA